MALQYPASADAHGGRGYGVGWFAGGLVVGAALAPRYVHPAPVRYYPAPLYYAPPPVVYSPPQVIVHPAPVVVPAPQGFAPAPPAYAPTQSSSLEDRLRRLRNLCEQGLLTAQECHSRREEMLREL